MSVNHVFAKGITSAYIFKVFCFGVWESLYACVSMHHCVPGVHGPSQKQQVLLGTEGSAQFTSVS